VGCPATVFHVPPSLDFRLDKDGKYELLADFHYFLVERGVTPGSPSYLPGLLEEIVEHYENVDK